LPVSLHDRDFRPVNCDGDCGDQNGSDTIFWAKMFTPRNVIPMRTMEMISAPTSVRQTLPTPPVIAAPPTTTAAIEGSRSSAANVCEPLVRRPARATPASAAKAAEGTKAKIFC